jgi:hypothetical protein
VTSPRASGGGRSTSLVTGTASRSEQRHGRIPTFADHDLTPEEEAQLHQFLVYLRSRKNPSGKG